MDAAALIVFLVGGFVLALGLGAPALGVGFIVLSIFVAWLLLRRRGMGWATVGLRSPRSWGRVLAIAAATAVGLFVVSSLVFSLTGATPDLEVLDPMRGDPVQFATILVMAWVLAAFVEELLFRGFLLERIATGLGGSRASWWWAVLLTSVLFGALHFYQGPAGIVATGVAGFVLGAVFITTGRNLWTVILAHGLIDTISLTVLFLELDRVMMGG